MVAPSDDRPALADLLHELCLCHDRLRANWKARLQLGANEMSALLHLASSGPLAMGELSERIKLSSAALTALVDRLEAMDYARRSSDPRDRRRVLLQVTERAVTDLEAARKALAESLDEYSAQLDDEQRDEFERRLSELSEVLSSHAAD